VKLAAAHEADWLYEISINGGKGWSLAALQDPVLPISQTRFRFPRIWDETSAVIQSRATDETGYSQPTHQQLVDERGPLELRPPSGRNTAPSQKFRWGGCST
jgi:hypothetical protein